MPTQNGDTLPYGLNDAVPTGARTAWGARLIVTQDGHVDLVPDRQGCAGVDRDAFLTLLGEQFPAEAMFAKLRELLVTRQMDTRTAGDFVLFRSDRLEVHANTNGSGGYCYVAAFAKPISNDPDGLECYSDHAEDIRTRGECSMCGSTEPDVIGHVLPDVPRRQNVDPVEAARKVVDAQTAMIFDGTLLDLFTAQHIVGVHDALSEPNKAKLRAMPLTKAAAVCFKLVEKHGR